MNKIKFQTLKGFRDYLPEEARKRQWLKGQMIQVFEKWGYEPLETPTLEPLEIFAGQIGEDEKLFFKFKDLGGRDVALRYDQTVPTCRVIGNYFGNITFPFKRYQIQPAFRAEKPQKGRYREFVQADIDIFGIKSAEADAEAIAVSLDLYQTLGFKEVVAVINDRTLLKDIPYPAIVAIDKINKIGKEGVLKEMLDKNISTNQAQKYLQITKDLKPNKTIKTIFDYLKSLGFPKNWYRFEPTLARSFSYSDGPIWEIIIPQYESGSVAGGERYDGLVEKFCGQDIGGTGIAFGFERTLEAIEAGGLLPKLSLKTKVLITVFSPETLNHSLKISSDLREKKIETEVYPDSSAKLDKQIKYADKKGIPYVLILGPEEIEKKTVTLKNLTTGNQTTLAPEKITSFLNNLK